MPGLIILNGGIFDVRGDHYEPFPKSTTKNSDKGNVAMGSNVSTERGQNIEAVCYYRYDFMHMFLLDLNRRFESVLTRYVGFATE